MARALVFFSPGSPYWLHYLAFFWQNLSKLVVVVVKLARVLVVVVLLLLLLLVLMVVVVWWRRWCVVCGLC